MRKTKRINKFTKLGVGATAVALMTGVVTPAAFANTEDVKAFNVVTSNENEGVGVESNNDAERRKALEEKYNITLTDSMVWEDKGGKVSHTTEDGKDVFYTSHDEMKAQGFYVVNANRQDLIQYGVQTGDWQPYRAFEAEKTPAYFEIVDGKYEYSKVYYGQMIRVLNSNYTYNLGKTSTEEQRAIAKAEYERELNGYLVKFRNAPGEVPYVVGLNNTAHIAAENNVPEPKEEFFNSKFNHPTVLSEGRFKDEVMKEIEKEKEDVVIVSSTLSRNNESKEIVTAQSSTVGTNEDLEIDLTVEDVEEDDLVSKAKEVITLSVEEDKTETEKEGDFNITSIENEKADTVKKGDMNITSIENEKKDPNSKGDVNITSDEKKEEEKVKEVKPPTKEELDALTGLESNDDNVRRKALEDEFGIELTDDIDWEDKEGKVASVSESGEKSYYTPHSEMKKLGFYAVNANRQELIQYAIKTGDWYPYRALEAKTSPAYFEIIDGKHEYNKVYYGNLIESTSMSYRAEITQINTSSMSEDEKKAKLEASEKEYKRFMKEYVAKFNDAPGIVPYVIGLNHTDDEAKANGVERPFDGYFDSKWNYPTVMSQGKFKPETE